MPSSLPPDAHPPDASGFGGDAPPTVLASDVADFLIELSIALHKHGMYPNGHPLLVPACHRVAQQVTDLIHRRGTLSLGVAETQLVIDGVATDPRHSVLRDLARRLHRHHLGVITFEPGVKFDEVQEFLTLVGPDADSTGKPLGVGPIEDLQQQPHIQINPVAYDRLHLKDDEEEKQEIWEAASQGGRLWIGLARAALGDDVDAEDLDRPSVIAKAIEDQTNDTEYDQVVVGYLMKIATELKTAGSADARALKSRLAKLVEGLKSDALQRLMRIGADSAQRRALVLDASYGTEVDTVVKLLEAAGAAGEDNVSDYLLRMLQKMAHHSEAPAGPRQLLAEQSVREQVAEIVQGWGLPTPNPHAYDAALTDMAKARPVFRTMLEEEHRAEAQRIIEMALEVDTVGATVVEAMREMAASDAVKWLLDVLEEHADSTVALAVRSELGDANKLREILLDEPLDVPLFDAVLPFLGKDAIAPMLETLIASESAQTRRHILDRLTLYGAAAAQAVMIHLDDDRWYVQRNMLTVLAALGHIPEEFEPDRFLQHGDARVRREAVRLLLRTSNTRIKAICSALADDDERTVRLALTAAVTDCPPAALSLVVAKAQAGSDETRDEAIRVLAGSDDVAAMEGLISLTQPQRKFFLWKHPPKTPEYLKALAALSVWKGDTRADRVLALARRRRDPEIVAATERKEPAE